MIATTINSSISVKAVLSRIIYLCRANHQANLIPLSLILSNPKRSEHPLQCYVANGLRYIQRRSKKKPRKTSGALVSYHSGTKVQPGMTYRHEDGSHLEFVDSMFPPAQVQGMLPPTLVSGVKVSVAPSMLSCGTAVPAVEKVTVMIPLATATPDT